MPKFLEDKLRAEYGNNPRAIYGTMNKIGAMRGNKETAKGREMERKHEADMKKPSAGKVESMRVEVHRGPKGEVTGHTVHTHMMPSASSKSAAFMEHTSHAQPFGAKGEHPTGGPHMLDHIGGQLGLEDGDHQMSEAEPSEMAEE